MQQYDVIVWTLKTVTSACTINGNPGYNTSLTCSDQVEDGTLTTTDTEYKFTNYSRSLFEDNIFNCVDSISETPAGLKGGNGLGSRSTINIVVNDFTGEDPNEDSPALDPVGGDPNRRNTGTYFGKIAKRFIVKNTTVKHEKWETDGYTHTLVGSTTHLCNSIKYTGNKKWSISCEDVLSKVNREKAVYPPDLNETLKTNIIDTSLTFTISNTNNFPASGVDSLVGRPITIGKDTMIVSSSVATGDDLLITVTRTNLITIGSGTTQRDYSNVPEEHESGDNVFIGVIKEDEPIANILISIFDAAGIPSSSYNVGDINIEITKWLVYSNISVLFNEPLSAGDLIDMVSKTFIFDTFSKNGNEVKVLANSPWKKSKRELIGGVDYNYDSLKWHPLEKERVTAATLRFNKKLLGSDDDQKNFTRGAIAINARLESENFYDDRTEKRISNTLFLGNSDQDNEMANNTVIRYVNRFANPEYYTLEMSEEQINEITPITLGDVVDIVDESRQNFDGTPERVRAQIIKMTPKYGVSRMYNVNLMTYNAYSGSVIDEPITITQNTDIILFELVDSPPVQVEVVFIIDESNLSQGVLNQTIKTGEFETGSIIHIVCINQSVIDARGGYGGKGGSSLYDAETDTWLNNSGNNGGDGGDCILIDSNNSITVNIYLQGSRTVDGIVYSCDGLLRAPGGGDSGFDSNDDVAGDGGNSAKGEPNGSIGLGGVVSGTDGTNGADGDFGVNDYGTNGTINGTNTAGQAGAAIRIVNASSNANVYTSDPVNDYISGNSDAGTGTITVLS